MATNERWEREAQALRCMIDLYSIIAGPKLFSTGSRGWYASQKVLIGDERVQVSITATVIGSKAPTVPAPDATKKPKKAKTAKVFVGGPGSKLEPDGSKRSPEVTQAI